MLKLKNKKKEPKKELTQEQIEYRERAKKEKERFERETSIAHKLIICFATKKELNRFREIFEIKSKDQFLPAEPFLEAAEFIKPKKRKRRFESDDDDFTGEEYVNPFEEIDYSDKLEKVFTQEAMLLYEHFKNFKPHDSEYTADSGYWLCFCFKSVKEYCDAVDEYDFERWGGWYLDGRQMLKDIEKLL